MLFDLAERLMSGIVLAFLLYLQMLAGQMGAWRGGCLQVAVFILLFAWSDFRILVDGWRKKRKLERSKDAAT